MVPTLRHGDQLLAWMRRSPRPGAGALVLVETPEAGVVVKRLVAVQPDGSLWVEGDNPFGSTDSRQFGPVPAASLRGRVVARLWPRPRLLGIGRRQEGHSRPSH
jgi:nickel-type superoxide dismutase maturation protease